MCVPTDLIGKVKEENGKKEETVEDTNQQMKSWKGGKLMEAGDGDVSEEREQQRKFY